jgi:hypothetical protein
MKKILLATILIFLGLNAKAQQKTDVSIRDVFKNKRHWELSLNHGFVRPTISPEFGPKSAYAINGRVFDLGLGYTFNATEKLGFTATGKAGAYPITLGIAPTDYSAGDSRQYFMYASYTVFAELGGTASYRHVLNDRFALVSGGGFGAKFIAPTGVRAGYSIHGSNSHSSYSIRNSGEAKPFLLLQTALQYKLKNSDLLGLRLSYHHSLKTVQEGSYYIASNSPDYSYGKVTFKGHQLSLGLLYTFTGYEKLQRRMAQETPNNKRELKKTMKREYFENRLEKSSAVRLYGALLANQNTSTDKYKVVGNIRAESLGFGANYYRAVKPAFFWETGLHYHEYWDGQTYQITGYGKTGSASSAFEAWQLNAGAGYIWRNKNLVPLFYFSGGAALGYNFDRNPGLVGGSHLLLGDPNTIPYFKADSENHILRRFFPLVYAGIRKDFCIRGKLFFSPDFRYYQGLTKVHEKRMLYTSDQITPEVRNATVFMRGSYFQYSLGLKLDL